MKTVPLPHQCLLDAHLHEVLARQERDVLAGDVVVQEGLLVLRQLRLLRDPIRGPLSVPLFVQVHNLGDPPTQLGILQEYKQEGRIRYIGMTTTSSRQYGALEEVMRDYPLDFIGIDYAVDNRAVEERILPLAQAEGIDPEEIEALIGENHYVAEELSEELDLVVREMESSGSGSRRRSADS